MIGHDTKRYNEMRLRHIQEHIAFNKAWLKAAENLGADKENLAVIRRLINSCELEEFKLKQDMREDYK